MIDDIFLPDVFSETPSGWEGAILNRDGTPMPVFIPTESDDE